MSIVPDSINPFAPSEEAKAAYASLKGRWGVLEAWGIKDKVPAAKHQIDFWQEFSTNWDHDDRDVAKLNAAVSDFNVVLRYAREKGYGAPVGAPTSYGDLWARWEAWSRDSFKLGLGTHWDQVGITDFNTFMRDVGHEVSNGSAFPPAAEAEKKYGPISKWTKQLMAAEARLAHDVVGEVKGVDIEAGTSALKTAAQAESAAQAAERELRDKLKQLEELPGGILEQHGGKIAAAFLLFGGVYAFSRWPGRNRR